MILSLRLVFSVGGKSPMPVSSGELLAARGGASEEQVGKIDAGDEQNEATSQGSRFQLRSAKMLAGSGAAS
jgi:hypothetical protein